MQRRRNQRVKKIAGILMAALVFLMLAGPCASAEERTTVRVAYPVQEGFTEVSDSGVYSGYTYDYLMEVAQYTHWNYEFVRVDGDIDQQLSTLFGMLIRGEVDLMGGMVYSDKLAEQLDFGSYNCGTSYYALSVLEDNTEITATNYFLKDPLRVAVIEGAETAKNALEGFAATSGFSVEEVACKSEKELREALAQGRADALLTTDVSQRESDLRMIAQFSPRPFYFAAPKGKKEIINGINMAMTRINESNPYFAVSLQEQYFTTKTPKLYLSGEEKKYISSREPLRVLAMGGRAPIQYRDRKTGEGKGVSADLLKDIAQMTGLRFELTVVDDYEDCQARISRGEVDLVAGINRDRRLIRDNEYSLSAPYISAPLSLVTSGKAVLGDLRGKQLALEKSTVYEGGFEGEVTYYDTLESCMEAVSRGKMDYCYGNSYSIQYYLSGANMKNLIAVPRAAEWEQEFCFGVTDVNDNYLLNILNKSIQSIPENDRVQNYLYSNAFQQENVSLWSYIKGNPLQAALMVSLIILLFAVLLLLWGRYLDRRNTLARRLENERYEQISELSNEFLYEYDVQRDLLKLPEKSARFLHLKKVTEHVSGLPAGEGQKEDGLLDIIVSAPEGTRERMCTLPDGGSCWLRIFSKSIVNEQGTPVYKVGKVVDIQQEKEQQHQLLERAQRDSMTGLYNAATSRQLVGRLLKEGDAGGAFFIADIDYFKKINDTAGHYSGDLVLQKVAQVFTDVFGEEDIVGRLGGDEFTVYCRHTGDRNDIAELCRKLQEQAAQIRYAGQKEPVTLSIGALCVRGGETFDELYQIADHALYDVKKQGRNGFKIIDG